MFGRSFGFVWKETNLKRFSCLNFYLLKPLTVSKGQPVERAADLLYGSICIVSSGNEIGVVGYVRVYK